MPPKRMQRAIDQGNSSDEREDSDAFSGSDDGPRSTDSSDSETERKKKKRKKQKSKKLKRKRSYDNSEDEDDPDSSSEEESSRRKSKKKKKKKDKKQQSDDETVSEKVPANNEDEKENEVPSKLDIKPLTEEELKEKYRYKRHKCKLSNVPMKKAISGQVSFTFNHCRLNFFYTFE